jgi:DNA-binding NtrC family response regulator
MRDRTRVLVVDDDAGFVRSVLEFGSLHDVEVSAAPTLGQARAVLRNERFDLVLIDLALPDGDGLDLLDAIELDHCRVAVVTGNPSVESAARSVQLQVIDYVIKPVEPGRLRSLLERGAEARSGNGQANGNAATNGQTVSIGKSPPLRAQDVPAGAEVCGEMLTRSARMRDLFRSLRLVSTTDATVLICGESGTGKELAARAVHELSGRKGPFVAVNCGAVAPDLLASQLFGHEKGSFTGAMRQHIGYFEQAEGGTLFLDEITEMPLQLQVHLLRVLETHRLTRVGSMQETPVDVRVVAATNREPEQAVVHGHLRQDLYFRLSDFPVLMPPLRDRPEDISFLADYFLQRLNERYGGHRQFSDQAKDRLRLHGWPGNVRELKNIVQRAFILTSDNVVEVDGLEQRGVASDVPESAHALTFRIGTPLEEMERRMVLKTLAYFGQDKTKTARALGVSVKTIYNKLVRYQTEAAMKA